MFGKINFSFSKSQQPLQNQQKQPIKPINIVQSQSTRKITNTTINNQHSNKNFQNQPNNLSNPSFSHLNKKS